MPIHFSDLDVVSELDGVQSALIVPCTMCPAATLAVREQKPFMQLFKSLLKSAPFERYIESLEVRLASKGVETEVFASRFYHQWFMCMWTAGRRAKLRKRASQHDAVIVLGCDSATETVREAADASGCKVIEGMTVSGIMNAHLGFHLPGSVTFDDCRIVPISGQARTADVTH
jgi:hypothetical protein